MGAMAFTVTLISILIYDTDLHRLQHDNLVLG